MDAFDVITHIPHIRSIVKVSSGRMQPKKRFNSHTRFLTFNPNHGYHTFVSSNMLVSEVNEFLNQLNRLN